MVRRIVAPERDVLNVMLRREIKVFDARDVTYLQDVYDHIVRTVEVADNYRDSRASEGARFRGQGAAYRSCQGRVR